MESAAGVQPRKKYFLSLTREQVLLGLILLVAAFGRFWRLDLMEFKADEAEAFRLACQVLGKPLAGSSDTFPLAGLTASIGVRNPPLFIYLIALPLVVAPSPFAAVIFIGLCNILAVWLCYQVGRKYFSPWVGLTSAAIYAVSPWALVYSRKIWAQDLLPVFACLFLLALYRFLMDQRPPMLAWLIILAGAAIQIHFSALVLLGVLAFAIFAGRSTFRWRWLAAGVVITVLLYTPYLLYLDSTHAGDFSQLAQRREGWNGGLGGLERFLLSLRFTFAASSADFTEFLTGIPWPCVWLLSIITGVAGVAGLAWPCFVERTRPTSQARLTLLIWFALPIIGLAILGLVPFPHYFVVLFPLPFLGLAAVLEKIRLRSRGLGGGLLGALLIGYAVFDVALFRSIEAQGGGAADYGIAYTNKVAAINFVLAENPDQSFVIASDFNLKTAVPLEYYVLLALKTQESHWTPKSPAARAYVLVDTFAFKLTPELIELTKGLEQKQFGPLKVFVIPLS